MSVPGRLGAAILGCAGLELTDLERRFFSEVKPTGFILFARNIDAPEQLRNLTASLREAVGWNAPILIDQEGGRVERFPESMARRWRPPLEEVANAGPDAARVMYLRARLIADDLLRYGIDVDCIPTLDIARPGTHPILRNRCYGETVEAVVSMGRATVDGLVDGGVLPVIKHMPGHGLAEVDSHLGLPRVSADAEALYNNDFKVFESFRDAPLGMSAHLVFEALADKPATVSPHMIALIREEIGFTGLLMTDDISMEALDGTVADRGAEALAAGCDVVLHCNGDLPEMEVLMARVGALSDAAQARAEAAFSARPQAQHVDIQALAAEFEALTSKA